MQSLIVYRYRYGYSLNALFTVVVLLANMISQGPVANAESNFGDSRTPDQRKYPAQDSAGVERGVLLQNGVERVYYLHRPLGDGDNHPLPLLLMFHGGDQGDALKMVQRTGFNAIADRERFAVVYPAALPVWNEGSRTTADSPDDVAFIRSLIQHLLRTENIDRRHIYATGASRGGIFTLRLACELSDQIAAFAPVIASFPTSYVDSCRPQRPVSILMINGTSDSFVPWSGGTIRKGRTRGRGGEVISVPETVAFWQQHNHCRKDPDIQQLPDINKTDDTTVKVWTYLDCNQGSTVKLVEIIGGGHTWAGMPVSIGSFGRRLVGNTSYDINASDFIWRFFQAHSLP